MVPPSFNFRQATTSLSFLYIPSEREIEDNCQTKFSEVDAFSFSRKYCTSSGIGPIIPELTNCSTLRKSLVTNYHSWPQKYVSYSYYLWSMDSMNVITLIGLWTLAWATGAFLTRLLSLTFFLHREVLLLLIQLVDCCLLWFGWLFSWAHNDNESMTWQYFYKIKMARKKNKHVGVSTVQYICKKSKAFIIRQSFLASISEWEGINEWLPQWKLARKCRQLPLHRHSQMIKIIRTSQKRSILGSHWTS